MVKFDLLINGGWFDPAHPLGNENRKKAGLQPLTPAEYLSAEAAYKKVMRDSQLPAGFYDQPEDFAKFLGNDVSPSELQSRVDIANQSIQNADPFYTDSLRRLYGLQSGDMLAYALDPERALPFITRQQKAAQFGAEAARQGLQVTTPMAETYTGQLGVSQEQARKLRCEPCDICGKKAKKMCIDHKIPGTYRGVLCQQCNTRLGWLEKNLDLILGYKDRGPQNAVSEKCK